MGGAFVGAGLQDRRWNAMLLCVQSAVARTKAIQGSGEGKRSQYELRQAYESKTIAVDGVALQAPESDS